MSDVDIYARGLCHCSACAPAEMDIKEVVAMVNYLNPTGIKSQWQLSTDKTFGDGTPNGHEQVCEGVPTRHWLLVC